MSLMPMVVSKKTIIVPHITFISHKGLLVGRYQKNGGVHGTAAREMAGHRISSFGT